MIDTTGAAECAADQDRRAEEGRVTRRTCSMFSAPSLTLFSMARFFNNASTCPRSDVSGCSASCGPEAVCGRTWSDGERELKLESDEVAPFLSAFPFVTTGSAEARGGSEGATELPDAVRDVGNEDGSSESDRFACWMKGC